jgi:hypothetical protein
MTGTQIRADETTRDRIRMTQQRRVGGAKKNLVVGGSILLLVAALGSIVSSPPVPRDAAAALTLITAAALGIERTLEAFWTAVGQLKNSWWPVGAVEEEVERLVDDLSSLIKPVRDQIEAELQVANQGSQAIVRSAEGALEQLDAAQASIERLRGNLAPDAQRAQLIATRAFQAVSYAEKQVPQVAGAAAAANQAIVALTDFVASFTDNPGRRLISLWGGAVLGLAVCSLLGLDVLAATVGSPGTFAWGSVGFLTIHSPDWGVLLTGLVTGLGSNPTHEVIRALQEYKKSRKADTVPAPDVAPPIAAALVPGAGAQLALIPPYDNGAWVPPRAAAAPHDPAESGPLHNAAEPQTGGLAPSQIRASTPMSPAALAPSPRPSWMNLRPGR